MSRKIKFLSRNTKKVLDKLSFLWYNKSTVKEKSSKREKKNNKATAQKEAERKIERNIKTMLTYRQHGERKAQEGICYSTRKSE